MPRKYRCLCGYGEENRGPALTSSQIAEVQGEMVRVGQPVRFLYRGQNLNIVTGELQPKGINVMYQIVYWNFPVNTSLKIARWLDAKAVIERDEGEES